MSDRVQALIHYYAREGFARQVQTVCNEVLKKHANDPVLVFWRAACGMIPEGSITEVRRVGWVFAWSASGTKVKSTTHRHGLGCHAHAWDSRHCAWLLHACYASDMGMV